MDFVLLPQLKCPMWFWQNDFSVKHVAKQLNLSHHQCAVSPQRKTKPINYGNQNKDTSRVMPCWVMMMLKTRRMCGKNPGQPPTERRAMRRQILCLLINTPSELTLFAPRGCKRHYWKINHNRQPCTYYIFPIASSYNNAVPLICAIILELGERAVSTRVWMCVAEFLLTKRYWRYHLLGINHCHPHCASMMREQNFRSTNTRSAQYI